MSAVADVLNRAADLIERDGWVQGRNRSYRGSQRCAWGAISDAALTYPTGAAFAAQAVVESEKGEILTRWNDTPGRTKAEVVDALRAAAERADRAA